MADQVIDVFDHINKNRPYHENQDDDLDNGLLPNMWGAPFWDSIHSVSFGYPDNPSHDDRIHYKTFFKMLAYVLPCKGCRNSYAEMISSGPVKLTDDVFENRRSLTYWLYKVHERVNEKTGKVYNITYEDLVKKYDAYRAKCTDKHNCSRPASPNPVTNDTVTNTLKNISHSHTPITPLNASQNIPHSYTSISPTMIPVSAHLLRKYRFVT